MSEQLASARDPLIGVRIDARYLVQSVIGRGGMGVVYAAVHEELQRAVAIKVLNPAWAADQDAAARFLREARVASSLSHPNIVDVWDLGRLPDGRPYLVMPRIAGEDLGSLLADEGPLHPQRAVQLLAGVASALDLIHGKGFVHRDIKPENLLHVVRDDGSEAVLVLDFGIAAAVMSESRLTKDGVLCGTPDFLPPEAASGALPDRRGDVYALATVAFELLTGRLPFLGVNPFQLLSLKLNKPAPTLTAASGRAFPEALEHVIARGLAQRPEDRYATAGEFIHALATAAAQAHGEIPDLSTADTHRQLARESSFIRKTSAAAAVEAAQAAPASPAAALHPRTAPYGAPSAALDPARAAGNPLPALGLPQAPPVAAGAPFAPERDPTRPPVLIIEEDDVDALVPSLRRPRTLQYAVVTLAVGVVAGGVVWALRSGAPPMVSSPAHGAAARVAADEAAAQPSVELPPAAPDPSANAASAQPPVAVPSAVELGKPARPAPVADRARGAGRREERSRPKREHASDDGRAAVTDPADDLEPRGEAPQATRELAPLEPSAPEAVLSIAPAAPPAPDPPPSLAASPTPEVAAAAEPVAPPPPPEPPRDRAQARALGERATAAMLQGQLASALTLYQDALKADPGYAAAWRGRGLALQQVGRPREAAQAFRQFLRLEPSGAQSDMIRARLSSLEQAHGL
jgi:serine/threonine-protein kinase